jgi:Tfp pilus tip-associated adhesin PilY1
MANNSFKWTWSGGKGLFALDVTNPNSPTHLFAINNDESNKVVHIGNSADKKMNLVMQVEILIQNMIIEN